MRVLLIAIFVAISYAQTVNGKTEYDQCACIGTDPSGSNALGWNPSGLDLSDYVPNPSVGTEQGMVNGNYGEYCHPWDTESFTPFDACKDPTREDCGSENYCNLKWCYVTEACAADTKFSSDVFLDDGSNVDGTPLYYSYSICGVPNCYDSLNNVGCPYDPNWPALGCADPTCGSCTGEITDAVGNVIPLAYAAPRASQFEPLVCVPCYGTVSNQKVSFGDTNPQLTCNVCDGYDLVANPVCTLPDTAPTGVTFEPAARITGACTPDYCVNATFVDIVCAEGYAPYNGYQIEISGCTHSDLTVSIEGCIAEKPETSIVEQTTGVDFGELTKYMYHTCVSSADCRPQHGFCDDQLYAGQSYCLQCPVAETYCDTGVTLEGNLVYGNAAECKQACFNDPTPTYTRNDCQASEAIVGLWSFNYDSCGLGEFCNVGTTESSGVYAGKCQICSIVDPQGSGQCASYTGFEHDIATRTSCDRRCNSGGNYITVITDPQLAGSIRMSDLEYNAGVNQYPDAGFCSQWGGTTANQNLCNDPDGYTTGKGYPTAFAQFSQYNYETENNDPCSKRYCQAVDSVPRCVVELQPDNTQCTVEVVPSGSGDTIFLAGECTNGYCMINNGTCPEGYNVVDDNNDNVPDYYEVTACAKQPVGRTWEASFTENYCALVQGACQVVPRSKQASCTSVSHSDVNRQWPNITTGAPTGGLLSQSWQYNLGAGEIPDNFKWMLFSQNPSFPTTTDIETITIPAMTDGSTNPSSSTGQRNQLKGIGIVCDPSMDQATKDAYNCIIKEVGTYQYANSVITVFSSSNRTSDIYTVNLVPNTIPWYPIFLCSDGISNTAERCFGSIECEYQIGTNQDTDIVCAGKYTQCERTTTFAPTIDPTIDPTTDPTSTTTTMTTTSTAHGDPIIWTFHEECYDLNKDGLYDATVNPRFNHDVKIGVYNDFMRELVVVDDEKNVLISINSLGEFEHDSQRFPYSFSFEEKDCPADMKRTECDGTYKEWNFDAQEFHYTVQLLRHDYKDAGIPEGDLGYHLDIYPKPYSRFYREGHIDFYSGLFFENPLPEELEYCPGGAPRNEGIKNEQSLAKDSKKLF